MKDIKMHQKKIENLFKMSGKDRYQYFIRKVADFETVWGLFADGWAMTADDEGKKAIPFWPEKELSSMCATEEWENYIPKKIELDPFLSKWIPGMEKDGVLLAIFPTPEKKGVLTPPKELLSSLKEELEQYE